MKELKELPEKWCAEVTKESLKKVQRELDAHNATIEFLTGEREELKKTV